MKTRILTLLLLAALLIPFTFAAAIESMPTAAPRAEQMDDAGPTPVPTAYPAHWNTDVFPQTYWDAMNELIPNPADLPTLIQAWEKEYTNAYLHWPYEYKAAMFALEELDAFSYPVIGIPAEDDIQKDKAIEIAWAQFRKDAEGVYDDAQLDAMVASYSFQYSDNDQHVWVFEFLGENNESFGFSIIDAKTGEFINHSASLGNG